VNIVAPAGSFLVVTAVGEFVAGSIGRLRERRARETKAPLGTTSGERRGATENDVVAGSSRDYRAHMDIRDSTRLSLSLSLDFSKILVLERKRRKAASRRSNYYPATMVTWSLD